MQLQDAVVLGLSLAALILSVMAIVFEIVFFTIQTRQASNITKDTASVTNEMKILLNDIRTAQSTTGQQVWDQYGKLLDAAIINKRDPAEVAAGSALQMEELNKKFQTLESSIKGTRDSEGLMNQTAALGKSIEVIKKSLQQLVSGVATEDIRGGQRASSSRYERFSDNARQVLTVSQSEAEDLRHNFVGPEHILLALTRTADCRAHHIMVDLGLDIKALEKTVKFVLGSKSGAKSNEVGLTRSAKEVIERAVDESRKLGDGYIGTEHLLLGIIDERGVAANLLEKLGVTREKVLGKLKTS